MNNEEKVKEIVIDSVKRIIKVEDAENWLQHNQTAYQLAMDVALNTYYQIKEEEVKIQRERAFNLLQNLCDMTNKEKSQEIARNDALYGEDPDNNSKIDECYIAALEMALWKDEQFKQILQVIYSKTLSIEKDVVIEIKTE